MEEDQGGRPYTEVLTTSFNDVVARHHPQWSTSDTPAITMSTLELHLGFDLTDIEINTANRRVNKHGQPLIEFQDFEIFVEQCIAAGEEFEHVFEDNTPVDYED